MPSAATAIAMAVTVMAGAVTKSAMAHHSRLRVVVKKLQNQRSKASRRAHHVRHANRVKVVNRVKIATKTVNRVKRASHVNHVRIANSGSHAKTRKHVSSVNHAHHVNRASHVRHAKTARISPSRMKCCRWKWLQPLPLMPRAMLVRTSKSLAIRSKAQSKMVQNHVVVVVAVAVTVTVVTANKAITVANKLKLAKAK